MEKRRQRSYDHRLVLQVREARDPTLATRLGVPRSTATSWLRRTPRSVTTAPTPEATLHELQRKLARVEKRCRRLAGVLRLLFVLLRVLKPDLSRLRFAGTDKARLLRAVDRTRGALGLRRVLSVLRLYTWKRRFGAMEPSEIKRLKQLEEENRRLKAMVADLSLDKQMLQEVLRKKD